MKMPDSDGLLIALDFAPQHFLPGHPVVGRLIVHSKSGVKTKGLSITLHGEVNISWSEEERVRKPHRSSSTSLGGTRHSWYSYEIQTNWFTAHETIINFPQNLLTGIHEIPPGENGFPFSFRLPPNIPSSIWCKYGHVEYRLSACLERSWGADWTTKMVIPVLALFDLRPLPQLSQPSEFSTEQTANVFLCFKTAPVKLWCRLQKTGFYPGEKIQFAVRLENHRDKKVRSLSAQLNQNFTLKAEGNKNWTTVKVAGTSWEKGTPPPSSGEDFWQGELLVPMCAPSGLGALCNVSHLISMYYTLNIYADIKGCCKYNPSVSCDVTIGSFPPEATQPVTISQRRF